MDGFNITQLQSLQSKDQAALLDTVDEIRRHGVNRYVSLPQIIVCGDQSSGKSSVLEAISGVQFPVNDGLCTRFTTEVILRRASENMAVVKLIPSKDATPEHKGKLDNFRKTSISHAEIPNLISEAKTIMGLTGNSTFSRDILQLEVSGPKLPHLTLVDLPGLIHHPNREQTEEDVRIPRDLVVQYMTQPRSIVLAIATAKNDTSNQIVLELAKTADPNGMRTMGIITKPDCLIRNSPNETAFYNLANNKETYFKLGWHILRNGDFNERKDSSFDRDEMEKKFFSSGIWRSLPASMRGVESLRTRLSHVLCRQIQKELPSLLKEIENELADCKATLNRLGSTRDTPSHQRVYLTAMAERFQELVWAGSEGIYQNPFFRLESLEIKNSGDKNKPSTRLRANVRKAEQKFLDTMQKNGHTYHLVASQPLKLNSGGDKQYISEKELLQEIRVLLDDSKGKELPGTFTPLLVGDLFVRQSKNWKNIAIEFVEGVWDLTKQFLDDVLAHVADESVRQAVLEEVIDPAMDQSLAHLKEKVVELHSPYARGYPATLNPRFVQELEKKKQAHQAAATQKAQQSSKSAFFQSEEADADPDTHACRELLYLMQAYYAIALDVFVDNVSSLAVENCLMIGLRNLLSPRMVSEMDDDTLEAIASESEDVRELRSQTLEKQASLQKSFELCRRQARKLSLTHDNDDNDDDTPKTNSNKHRPFSPTGGITKQLSKTTLSKTNLSTTSISPQEQGANNSRPPASSTNSGTATATNTSSTSSESSKPISNGISMLPSSTNNTEPETKKTSTVNSGPFFPTSRSPGTSGGLFAGAGLENTSPAPGTTPFGFGNGPKSTSPAPNLFTQSSSSLFGKSSNPASSPAPTSFFGTSNGFERSSTRSLFGTNDDAFSTSTSQSSNQINGLAASQTSSSQGNGKVDFSYLDDVPVSFSYTDHKPIYPTEIQNMEYLGFKYKTGVTYHISGINIGVHGFSNYSPDEIRLKDYKELGLLSK